MGSGTAGFHPSTCSEKSIHPPIARAVLFALAFIGTLILSFSLYTSAAHALSVQSTTARPNSSDKTVIGGVPTRVTWNGMTQTGEDITQVALVFPSGTMLEGSSVRATVLQGLDRLDVNPEVTIEGEEVRLAFAEPLPADVTLRIEVEGLSFPLEGGELTVGATYQTAAGTEGDAGESPAINVVFASQTDRIVEWLDAQDWVTAWNSNKFLSMFFKPQLVVESTVLLFGGWLKALALVAVGFPLAIPLGLMFAFMKMSGMRILRALAAIYINVIRGTPLFLQIYIAFFGLPLLGIELDNFVLGFGVMAFNSSAYLAEIFRAGIQSIPKGQFEAAASLGMNSWQTMFFVILPQTVRRVIPTMTSEFIMLYKDTSLLSSVGVMELMMFSKNLTSTTGNITPYIVAAGYYLLITIPLIKVVGMLERKLAENETGKEAPSPNDTSPGLFKRLTTKAEKPKVNINTTSSNGSGGAQ